MPVWPCVTGHRLQKGLRDTSVAQQTPSNSVLGEGMPCLSASTLNSNGRRMLFDPRGQSSLSIPPTSLWLLSHQLLRAGVVRSMAERKRH